MSVFFLRIVLVRKYDFRLAIFILIMNLIGIQMGIAATDLRE
jgi:hypothetical protein